MICCHQYKWFSVSPEINPVEGIKALGSLEVIREDKVVKKGNGKPNQVGAEEEELAGDKRNPPAWGRHCCLLRCQQTNNKGIGDAGSTADIRILWSAIVCLSLL